MRELKKTAMIILTKAYLWLVGILKKHDNKLSNTLRRWLHKRIRRRAQRIVPPKFYPGLLGEWFWIKTGKNLNLDAPCGFCEKIQWLKLNDATPLKTRLSDKYLVREWVADKIGKDYIVPILGVWDKYEAIDFNTLPDAFVLKANHGSGMNCIVRNKNEINHEECKKNFSEWMSMDYAIDKALELPYSDISRKIIAEKYLEDDSGVIYDFRFFCANGKVMFYRITENITTLSAGGFSFDRNKKHLPMTYFKNGSDNIFRINETADIDKMFRLSEFLAEGFIFVRVDWYEVNGKQYFGEMTFAPRSGFAEWGDKLDAEFGEQIKLPIE